MSRRHTAVPRGSRAVLGLVALPWLSACALWQREPAPAPVEMPPMAVERVAEAPRPLPPASPVAEAIVPGAVSVMPGDSLLETRLVTLTATDADIRSVLQILAEEAGISLLLTPEVKGRVSVAFNRAPALDALRSVVEQAGFTLGSRRRTLTSPWDRVVFYDLKTNVDSLTRAEIMRRYNVGPGVADAIIEARKKP